MARPRPAADGAAAPATLAASGSGRFELAGDVGVEDAARLLAEGDAAFAGAQAVEVDLGQVGHVDSAGLALLLEWTLSARDAGRSVRYLNVPASVASLAGIGDVAELLAPPGGG